MKVVLLGTNGFGPSEDGHTACCMLPEVGIVLDAGSGLFRMSDYLQTPALQIYLSHAHLDHIIGLTYLWGAVMRRQVDGAKGRSEDTDLKTLLAQTDAFTSRISIAATATILAALYERFGKWEGQEYLTLDKQQQLPQDGVLTYFPVSHTTECIGFRLEWKGHSMAYVTDTIADPEHPYVEKLRGVDLLLHDSYLPDKWAAFAWQTGHSYTSGAAQVAAKAQVGRLILIHHNTVGMRVDDAELESARSIFPATEVGLDRMEIEF